MLEIVGVVVARQTTVVRMIDLMDGRSESMDVWEKNRKTGEK